MERCGAVTTSALARVSATILAETATGSPPSGSCMISPLVFPRLSRSSVPRSTSTASLARAFSKANVRTMDSPSPDCSSMARRSLTLACSSAVPDTTNNLRAASSRILNSCCPGASHHLRCVTYKSLTTSRTMSTGALPIRNTLMVRAYPSDSGWSSMAMTCSTASKVSPYPVTTSALSRSSCMTTVLSFGAVRLLRSNIQMSP